jgi:hypothetical protein
MVPKRGGKTKKIESDGSFCFIYLFIYFIFYYSAKLFLVLFCCGSIVAKKKKTIISVTFFDGFVARNWRPAPFCWFCCKEGDSNNVIAFFYGVVMPFSMVVVMM